MRADQIVEARPELVTDEPDHETEPEPQTGRRAGDA
jgi:hypothetical protein